MSARDISDKCGKTALLFDYINKNKKDITTIGIGDGGNECGMGKVVENVRKYIKNGEQIGCVVSAEYLITAGVSNWGAEALGIGMGIYCDDKSHKEIYMKSSEVGSADGINGEFNGSVDGLPYTQHAKMYSDLCDIYERYNDEEEEKTNIVFEKIPVYLEDNFGSEQSVFNKFGIKKKDIAVKDLKLWLLMIIIICLLYWNILRIKIHLI